MGISNDLQEQLKRIRDTYNNCYTNDENIYEKMPANHNIETELRNYLAYRLMAERACKSGLYDEETRKAAQSGVLNMIQIAATNAPAYTPNIDIMDIDSITAAYDEYYKGRNGCTMWSVKDFYIYCGKDILDSTALLSTYSEPHTYVNKKTLAQLKYITDKLEIKDIQTLYSDTFRDLVVPLGADKYTNMTKGILQEYFKEILLDRDEVINQYSEDFNKQINEGKEKEEIPKIQDWLIDKYFNDKDYTKDLDENRKEFVKDKDDAKKLDENGQKSVEDEGNNRITFSRIRATIKRIVKERQGTARKDKKIYLITRGDDMLTKAKMLYQVKLILDYLPKEEYNLIPKETINYIEENFEYDEKIQISPNIPLENQNIDDETYKYLEKIINEAEKNKKVSNNNESTDYIKESNKNFETSAENIRLQKLVKLLKKENEKIPKAKKLVEEYKNALAEKNKEIEVLEKNNKYLRELINRIPKFIRKFFIKDDIKLLNEGK